MSKLTMMVLLVSALAMPAAAQTDKTTLPPPPEKKFYRLDFTVRELDGDSPREHPQLFDSGRERTQG